MYSTKVDHVQFSVVDDVADDHSLVKRFKLGEVVVRKEYEIVPQVVEESVEEA